MKPLVTWSGERVGKDTIAGGSCVVCRFVNMLWAWSQILRGKVEKWEIKVNASCWPSLTSIFWCSLWEPHVFGWTGPGFLDTCNACCPSEGWQWNRGPWLLGMTPNGTWDASDIFMLRIHGRGWMRRHWQVRRVWSLESCPLQYWNVWKGSVRYESRRFPVLCLHSFRCRILVPSITMILQRIHFALHCIYRHTMIYWYTVIFLSHCIINTAHCIFSQVYYEHFSIKTCMFRCRAVRWCRAARGEGKIGERMGGVRLTGSNTWETMLW